MISSRGRETAVAVAGLVLAGSLALLAVPGRSVVPGAAEDAPRWLLGVFGDGLSYGPERYLLLLFVAMAAWVVFSLGLASLPSSPGVRRALWALIAVLVGAFVLAPPLHSLDVFSYISYGGLQNIGFSPYEHTPGQLLGDPAAVRVEDFRFTVSSYGPLFTLLSALLAQAGTTFALWALKLIAGLSVLALTALTVRIARVRGVPELGAAAFVALNPLTLAHVVGGAHNDALMMALALAGVLALLTARPAIGGAWIVTAVAVKATAALYLPFALAARGPRLRLLGGIVAAAAVIALVALAFYGSSATEAVGVVGENQDTVSHWSVVATLARGTGIDVDTLRVIAVALYGVALIWLLAWTVRGGDWVRAAGWATFGLLVATAWMVPWYMIWLLPLAAVSRDRALIAGAVLLTFFQAANGLPL